MIGNYSLMLKCLMQNQQATNNLSWNAFGNESKAHGYLEAHYGKDQEKISTLEKKIYLIWG